MALKIPLHQIENELKKRHAYSYQWGRKQNDAWDKYSNFIYTHFTWEALVEQMRLTCIEKKLDKKEFFQYASIRWYNFWSAKAIESIFANSEKVSKVSNPKDSEKDFFIHNIPFDHKTTVFPKAFGNSIGHAQQNKKELIVWLYKNQSSQKRFHLKNRLFIVVYDGNGNHWKLKAEITALEQCIQKYLSDFKPSQIQSFTFAGQNTLSDVLFFTKNA